MKRIFVGLILSFLLGFPAGSFHNASAQSSLASPYTSNKIGATFPISLGDFRLIRFLDFEPQYPGYGVSVAYKSDRPFITAEVFIYDKGISVPSGDSAPVVRAEIDDALAQIQEGVQARRYESARVTAAPASCRVGQLGFHCATIHNVAITHTLKVPTTSRFFVRGIRGQFVKVRIDWPEFSNAQAGPVIERFLTSLDTVLPRN